MFKTLVSIVLCFRPLQWIKNLIIFVPLVFSKSFLESDLTLVSVEIFIAFSFFVGNTYILNDIKDIAKDKLHPTKKDRPIARGDIDPKYALLVSITFIILTLLYVYTQYNEVVFYLFIGYLINTILYSYFIKSIVILDVFSISLGFIIRALIGAFVIDVQMSSWLLVLVFLGSLFFGFIKRYQEVNLLHKGISSRKNIDSYNEKFLKQMINVLMSLILISYTFYTFQSVQSELMLVTLPIVMYSSIRFYYNVFFLEQHAEGIEKIILGDRHIVFSALIYIICVFSILMN